MLKMAVVGVTSVALGVQGVMSGRGLGLDGQLYQLVASYRHSYLIRIFDTKILQSPLKYAS